MDFFLTLFVIAVLFILVLSAAIVIGFKMRLVRGYRGRRAGSSGGSSMMDGMTGGGSSGS